MDSLVDFSSRGSDPSEQTLIASTVVSGARHRNVGVTTRPFFGSVRRDLRSFDVERYRQLPAANHLGLPEVVTYDDLFHHPRPPINWLCSVVEFAQYRYHDPTGPWDLALAEAPTAILLCYALARIECRQRIDTWGTRTLLKRLREVCVVADSRYARLIARHIEALSINSRSGGS